MSKPLEIGNNMGGAMRFDKLADLRGFAEAQADRLASLMCVLKEWPGTVEEMYLVDVIRIASDMAYEVKQAIELINKREVAHD